jgi:hypothetical protein
MSASEMHHFPISAKGVLRGAPYTLPSGPAILAGTATAYAAWSDSLASTGWKSVSEKPLTLALSQGRGKNRL